MRRHAPDSLRAGMTRGAAADVENAGNPAGLGFARYFLRGRLALPVGPSATVRLEYMLGIITYFLSCGYGDCSPR
jgi:hypothetical protein